MKYGGSGTEDNCGNTSFIHTEVEYGPRSDYPVHKSHCDSASKDLMSDTQGSGNHSFIPYWEEPLHTVSLISHNTYLSYENPTVHLRLPSAPRRSRQVQRLLQCVFWVGALFIILLFFAFVMKLYMWLKKEVGIMNVFGMACCWTCLFISLFYCTFFFYGFAPPGRGAESQWNARNWLRQILFLVCWEQAGCYEQVRELESKEAEKGKHQCLQSQRYGSVTDESGARVGSVSVNPKEVCEPVATSINISDEDANLDLANGISAIPGSSPNTLPFLTFARHSGTNLEAPS